MLCIINDETKYKKVSEIDINQNAFQFKAKYHYQINLNKGYIVYFRMYLLAKDRKDGIVSINIGILNSPTIRPVGKDNIYGLDIEFDQK